MDLNRKPFQGVLNIIRFNWPFYLFAFVILNILLFTRSYLPPYLESIFYFGLSIAFITVVLSLLTSYYIYDFSNLYKLSWIAHSENEKLLNINAGFDETSQILKDKFKNSKVTICDFYNKEKHTEASIERARKAYPPLADTLEVSTDKLPFSDNHFDKSIAIFSAHEIRDNQERIAFFKELSRVTKTTGQIIVTEHLRDFNNSIAYSIGVLHFLSRRTWQNTFKEAKLNIISEIKTTAFITSFILQANGTSS